MYLGEERTTRVHCKLLVPINPQDLGSVCRAAMRGLASGQMSPEAAEDGSEVDLLFGF